MQKKKKKSADTDKYIIIAITAVLAIVLAITFPTLLSTNNILKELTVEAGTELTPELFFKNGKVPQKAEITTSLVSIPTNTIGAYTVNLTVRGKEYECALTVADTKAPTANPVLDAFTWGGILPAPEQVVTDISDATAVNIEYKQAPDVSRDGIANAIVKITDEGGNVSEIPVSIKVTVDTEAPVISGASDRRIYLGEPIDFSEGVTVTDDKDTAPTLTVDDGGIGDTPSAGRYTVTYTARDGAGNQSSKTVVFTLIKDALAPVISGTKNINTYVGADFDLLEGVTVSDDHDQSVTVTVDDSALVRDKAGTYKVTYSSIDASGNKAVKTITVKLVNDVTAPKIEVSEVTAGQSSASRVYTALGHSVDMNKYVKVSDDLDPNVKLISSGTVDFNKAGEYKLTYSATDASGNSSSLTVTVVVEQDIEAPVIKADDFEIFLGESVSYRKHVTVTDKHDPAPVLTIDSSAVNINVEGEYTVNYTATDASGNKASASATVKVSLVPSKSSLVECYAKEVLEEILTPSMSDMEKAFAIYWWSHDHIKYIGTSDKSDWIIGAYDGFTTRQGDCFTFYSVSRALYTYAGIDNLPVQKVKKKPTASNHYWNLICIDGSWYFADSNHFKFSNELFMLTQAEMDIWDKRYYADEHYYGDVELPEIATVSVQKKLDYARKKVKVS